MFVVYFVKVMLIILVYTVFFMSSMILLNYMREALFLAAYNEDPKPVRFAAKAIVFSANFVFLIGSALGIYLTFGWQKSLVSGVRETVAQQPAFAVTIILLALYPILVVRKLAAEQQSE